MGIFAPWRSFAVKKTFSESSFQSPQDKILRLVMLELDFELRLQIRLKD